MPELSPSPGASAPPWRRFVSHRFADPTRRELLRTALRRTLNRSYDRRTIVYVIGPPACGKSALIRIVERTCAAAGVPASHAGFTHAFGEEPAHAANGTELTLSDPTQLPMVIWAIRNDKLEPPRHVCQRDGHDAIYVDLSVEPVERTPRFAYDVGTLDVLTWIAEPQP